MQKSLELRGPGWDDEHRVRELFWGADLTRGNVRAGWRTLACLLRLLLSHCRGWGHNRGLWL